MLAEIHPQYIKIVMDDNYPPFSFKDSDGKQQGILIDQWRLWEQKTGIKAEISTMDWGKALSRMKAGEFDVIDTVFKTEERSGWLDFTKPYAKIEVPIFFDKEISGITDAASLKGFVVADKRGDAMIDILKRNGVDNLLLFDSFEAIIQAAKERKVTVFVMGKPPANYFLHKYGILDHFKQSAPLNVGHFHRAVKKGNGQLLKTVEEGFRLISPDELKDIETKWFGAALANGHSMRYLAIVAGSLGLLVLALYAWNNVLRRAVNARTAELKTSEEKFRAHVENSFDVIFTLNSEGTFEFVSNAWERHFGYPVSEVIGRSFAPFVHRDDAAPCAEHLMQVLSTGQSGTSPPYRVRHADGSWRWFIANGSPCVGTDGKLLYIGVAHDITEQKLADEALRESEERLRIIFEASESGIILVSPQGVMEFANRRMSEMFGMSHQELIGTTYYALLHETERMVADERMFQLIRGEIQSVVTERHYIRKDGTDFWGYLSGRRLENPDGSLRSLVGVISDITERKQTARLLAESELCLRTLVQTIPDLIWLKNVDGVYLSCNAMFERFFGAGEADIVGKTDYDFVDRELADFFREHDRKAMAAGRPTSNEECVTFADDGHTAWLDTIKTPMRDSEGKLVGVLGIARDITDRKNSEERRLELERQLLHSQKLESLGVLSGGIAHDFNNLLLAVLGNLDLALMKLPGDATARKNIDQAINASRHAAKLTNMMLAYSGKGNFIIKELNLSELLEENAAMLSAAISKTVKLDLQLDHELPPVMADAGQIQQVVMNLITNASEAIGDVSGSITLSTGVRRFDQVELDGSRLEEKLSAGCYVWMEVRDTGCGMDGETLRKLFDPFFTTKFTGRGLGMSAVLGIIRAHKGAFLVESRPAAGTTIRVLFPIADFPRVEHSDTPVAAVEVVTAAANAGVILVVDDEEMIRGVCVDLLEELGFETIVATDGEEALRIFCEQDERICLVLLDQVMPGMDGVAVFLELRRIRPEIKVLLSSGFSEQEVSERFKGLGLDGFIQKPFDLNLLADEVRRVLGDAG